MAVARFILQGLDRDDDHFAAVESVFSLHPIDRGLVATAFMNAAGAQMLVDMIGDNQNIVDIFVGVRNGVTTIQALEILMESGIRPIIVDTATQAFIFHPKVYLANNRREARLVVGSANSTTGGLAKNIEASIYNELSMYDEGHIIDSIYESFGELCNRFPNNVFALNTLDDLDAIVEESILVDERAVSWRASGVSHSRDGTEIRQRMRINTRSLPRSIRTAREQAVIEPVQNSDIAIALTPHNNLLWRSSPLTRRDLNIPTGASTNRTGSMLLKKGDISQDIDQRVYFRHEVFANEDWQYDPRPHLSYFERCVCDFRIIIKGIDYGVYSLRLSHNTRTDTATYAQNNSVTQIHWGQDVVRLVAREELLGSICRLYAPDENGTYTLVFDED